MSSSRTARSRRRIRTVSNVTSTTYFRDGVGRRCPLIARRQWEAISECDKPDIDFVNEHIGNSFKCAICMDILTDPVSIGCSHIFCSSCIQQAIDSVSSNSNDHVHTCPTCRQPFQVSAVQNNNFAKRMINDLIIKCPNHQFTDKRNVLIQQRRRAQRDIARNNSRSRSRDRNSNNNNEQKEQKENESTCNWTGEYRQLSNHLSECEFTIIPCGRCYMPILRNEIQSHRQVCPWLIMSCNQCNQTYKRCQLAAHECPLQVISCAYCAITYQRQLMLTHHRMCCRKPIKCRFYEYGCNRLIVRADMNAHVAQNQSEHLLMIGTKCDEMVANNSELEDRCGELETNHEELQDNYDTLEQELEELKGDYETLKENHDELRSEVDSIRRIQTALLRSLGH